MRFALIAVAAMLLSAPARAWEAKASGVEKRLRSVRTPAAARQKMKPRWARKIGAPDEKVHWTESHGGKTYVFGVGLARNIENPGLRVVAAQDRARASLLEAKSSGTLEGSEILDWYLDRSGGMHALAVLIR